MYVSPENTWSAMPKGPVREWRHLCKFPVRINSSHRDLSQQETYSKLVYSSTVRMERSIAKYPPEWTRRKHGQPGSACTSLCRLKCSDQLSPTHQKEYSRHMQQLGLLVLGYMLPWQKKCSKNDRLIPWYFKHGTVLKLNDHNINFCVRTVTWVCPMIRGSGKALKFLRSS